MVIVGVEGGGENCYPQS